MATVPIYNGPQVREQATQPVFQQNIDVSSGGKAMATGLGAVAELSDRIGRRDAETAANTADAQLTRDWNQWEDENRKNYQGKDAAGYTAAVDAWWKKSAEVYGAELTPMARSLVGKSLQRRQTVALDGAGKYQTTELERHADNQAFAAINRAVEFGVRTGDAEGQAQAIRDTIAEMGARKRWTKEQRDEAESKHISTLHLATISKLAVADAAGAQAYFDRALKEGEIPVEHQGRIADVIKGEGDNQFATGFAAQNAALPFEQQLAEAGKIQDPERKRKTLIEIKNAHALVKEAKREQEMKYADTAWQLVGQGKRVPEAVLAAMDGRERVTLQDYLRTKAEQGAAGVVVKTNPQALARVYDMMRDDPEGFKKLRMEPLTTAIGASDMEQIARIQREMVKPDPANDAATTTQMMSTYVAGWKPEKKATFQRAAFDEIERFKQEKGRVPSYEEKKKLLDNLVLDGEVMSGKWYSADADKKYFEATPEERKNFAPTISSDDRKLVVAALRSEGIDRPNDDQILQRYKLAKGIK